MTISYKPQIWKVPKHGKLSSSMASGTSDLRQKGKNAIPAKKYQRKSMQDFYRYFNASRAHYNRIEDNLKEHMTRGMIQSACLIQQNEYEGPAKE